MNKKFTFMVAALLAAGGFSANAAIDANKITKDDNGKSYFVVLSATGSYSNSTDKLMGSKLTEANGAIGYDAMAMTSYSSDMPTSSSTFTTGYSYSNYIWKVNVSTVNGKTVVKLINAATGYALAVNTDNGNALVSNNQEYTNGSELDDTFVFTTDGKLTFDESANSYLDGTSGLTATETSSNGDVVLLVEVADEPVEVSELQNIGTAISMDFEGSIEGEDLFENVSVVTLEKGGTKFSAVTATANDNKFLFQIGNTDVTAYDLTDSEDLKKFNAAEFIVLTSRLENAQGEAYEGYSYSKVKGEKLIQALQNGSTAVKSGEYPVQNAIFSAVKNANKEGKYAFKHNSARLFMAADDNTWVQLLDLSSGSAYIGYNDCGVAASATLASSATPVYATVAGGTAVEVKNLVKGQWIVNILASEDKNSTVMKRVVYSSQASSTQVAISTSTDETNAHKDAVYAQWIVSADKGANTVTFKNRETGKEIPNVTLFSTPKEGVYAVNAANLNNCYVELRTVENTTQWDGYLKLSADDVNSTEYTLSVDAGNLFDDEEAVVIASTEFGKTSQIVKTTDESAKEKPLTFKLAQSSTKNGETTKLDTVIVKEISYGFYKDGEFTTAKDTLKAISYTMAGLKNIDTNSYNGMSKTFALGKDLSENTGKFIFRKVGDQYQIATEASYADNKMVAWNTDKFDISGEVGVDNNGKPKAQYFFLNPVAVAPNYDVPESHIALQINGAYLGSKADGNAIMTNDTSMLKSTVADAAFSFYAFSADKEEAKTPSYYLSSNGMMMYSPANEIAAINKEISELSPVFDAEEIAELEAKRDAYMVNGENLVKFQRAKYEAADKVALADTTYTKDDDLKPFKFNVLDVDGQAVLKNAASGYVKAINDVVVFTSSIDNAAKFDVVAAEAPTSNESVSASEVKVIANNGSIIVKNAAGKNVVVSTILGRVVANEVLTSDNATINVPAGIVVVAVEGESFKVNVK